MECHAGEKVRVKFEAVMVVMAKRELERQCQGDELRLLKPSLYLPEEANCEAQVEEEVDKALDDGDVQELHEHERIVLHANVFSTLVVLFDRPGRHARESSPEG